MNTSANTSETNRQQFPLKFLYDWRFSVFCCKDWSPRFSQVLLFWHKLSRRTLSPLHWNLFTFTMKPPICIKLLSPSSLFDKYLDITSMAVYINIPVVLVATWANTFNFMTCSAVNLWWHKKICKTCEAQTLEHQLWSFWHDFNGISSMIMCDIWALYYGPWGLSDFYPGRSKL